jgi:prolyl oligopeptidase
VCLLTPPPFSLVEPVVDVLHGVPISDPYRWLEEQNSPRTRAWLEEQTRYARSYLDALPGRERIRERVRELLDVETQDSFLIARNRYFFRKRLPGQEQPCIYLREGCEGSDELLVDPGVRRTGNYTAVKPLRVSADGNLLLYEVKQGGERTGIFELFDVASRKILPDSLPHGYLRGFAFASDEKGFYYSHEASSATQPLDCAVYHHALGTRVEQDRQIFCAGQNQTLRLTIVTGRRHLGFLVYRFLDKTYTDFYLWRMGSSEPPLLILRNAGYRFDPRFLQGRILAAVDCDAPNCRIVEVQPTKSGTPLFFNLVPETDMAIRSWLLTANHIVVSYAQRAQTQLDVFHSFGKRLRQIPCKEDETVHLLAATPDDDEVLVARESFTRPIEINRYSVHSGNSTPWMRRELPFDPAPYPCLKESFPSADGTRIPIFLLGERHLLSSGIHPAIMTSYGGYGIPMTPQFSVLVAFLVEHGCLFALPNIRGGAEFGADWRDAAKRRNRQTAFDDFLAAAEWLVQAGRTRRTQLAIFGGSNSGLLVAAAITQRPDLFRAALCMVPMTDMLRYQLFDNAHVLKDEFGTAEDAEDFHALLNYSPYHAIRERTAYPATMFVSGDADQNCNALHARKMVARLQAANSSENPILLDYGPWRGHSPVLPLSVRIEALTDRLVFLCAQLQVRV